MTELGLAKGDIAGTPEGAGLCVAPKPCPEDPRLSSSSAPVVRPASLTGRKLGGFHVHQAFDAAHGILSTLQGLWYQTDPGLSHSLLISP